MKKIFQIITVLNPTYGMEKIVKIIKERYFKIFIFQIKILFLFEIFSFYLFDNCSHSLG